MTDPAIRAALILGANNWVVPGAATDDHTYFVRARQYAKFHGLDPDSPDLATEIVKQAACPRCAMPDIPMALVDVPLDSDEIPIGVLQNRSSRWPHKAIRVWTDMDIPGFTRDEVQACYRRAIMSWAEVCDIRPVLVSTKAETNIFAHLGRIDIRGMTLAWSYLPWGGISENDHLEQKYDSAEPWKQYGMEFLVEVMAHELGHALGIGHLSSGNLMQPFATGKIIKPQRGDIAEAQARYGPPVAAPPVDPPPVDPDDPIGPLPPPAGPVEITTFTSKDDRYELVLRSR